MAYSKSKRLSGPSPRTGPSRNGTRPTSTVIWPRSRRRAEHLLTALKLKLGGDAVPSRTDFVSDAVDAAAVAQAKKHGVVFPPHCDFSVTKE